MAIERRYRGFTLTAEVLEEEKNGKLVKVGQLYRYCPIYKEKRLVIKRSPCKGNEEEICKDLIKQWEQDQAAHRLYNFYWRMKSANFEAPENCQVIIFDIAPENYKKMLLDFKQQGIYYHGEGEFHSRPNITLALPSKEIAAFYIAQLKPNYEIFGPNCHAVRKDLYKYKK